MASCTLKTHKQTKTKTALDCKASCCRKVLKMDISKALARLVGIFMLVETKEHYQNITKDSLTLVHVLHYLYLEQKINHRY